jgi:hypothetical protein
VTQTPKRVQQFPQRMQPFIIDRYIGAQEIKI